MLTRLSTVLTIVVYNLVDSLVDMNKSPISFRFTDHEYELLEKEQQEGESINQTAARLLREKLGILDVDNTYTLESTTLRDWIVREINSQMKMLQWALESQISDEIKKINQRLETIESKLPKPRTKKAN